jgi:hypothetical protein
MTATATSHTVPCNLWTAVAEMHACFHDFQSAQTRFVMIAKEHAEHDALSSRIRIVAVDRLIKTAGMTKTDAQRDARLDPEYATHGDMLTALANRKTEAEGELYTAKARLEVAIATVKAFSIGNGEIG